MTFCSQQHKWNREQRESIRQALRDYRQMVYLENLSDAEFMLFADDVAMTLESEYPVYSTFTNMPAVDDTVDLVVVTTIVNNLKADARNLRHLYPYSYLVAQGVVSAGLEREQMHSFYKCLAQKIDSCYGSMNMFFAAVLADTTNSTQIGAFEQQCASELFNWTSTEVGTANNAAAKPAVAAKPTTNNKPAAAPAAAPAKTKK